MTASLRFEGVDLLIDPEDLDPDFVEAVRGCCPPGQDAEPFVDRLMERFEVTGDPSDCRLYLTGYGAWDDTELRDHETNLKRLVWLTAGAFCDGEVAYFCTY